MRKSVLIICSALITASAIAQECKYRKNAKDEFTGDQLKMTEWQTILNHTGLLGNHAVHLSLVAMNGEEFVEIMYQAKKSKSEVLAVSKNKTKLMFKLANGEVVTLEYAGDDSYISANRKRKTSKSGKVDYFYTLTCKFALTEHQKDMLAGSAITKLRMTLYKDVLELDIPEKTKNQLLGFSSRGQKPKKFLPQSYFLNSMGCL